jgi:uncharacterized membrane protein
VAAAATGDWVTILGVVVAATLALIGALLTIIFNDIRRQVRENTRQLAGLLKVLGPLMWRLIAMEEWQEKMHGYTPPPEMKWPEL